MDHIIREDFIMEKLREKMGIIIHKIFVIVVDSEKILAMASADNSVISISLKDPFIREKDLKES